jgi:hypothetical protein
MSYGDRIVIYLKYDPWKGEPIPDGCAEQYAVDVVNVANEDLVGDRHFSVSNELVISYFRALVVEKAVDPMRVTIQMPDCPDQFVSHRGSLNHWPRRAFLEESLLRIMSVRKS